MPVYPIEVRVANEIDAGFAKMLQERVNGAIVFQGFLISDNAAHILQSALRQRIAVMSSIKDYVLQGALMSFGPDTLAMLRLTAVFVDKILKGAKPADLPVEQPTKFELVINLKTAKALGLTIPPSLLQRADQVIE
jgi:ABC-type uncharacterized transport system substrate-binding protein